MSDYRFSHKSKSDDFSTPTDLYNALNAEFHFTDDPCPLGGGNEWTCGPNGGLDRPWGKCVFMNPPYSKPEPWVKKAYQESLLGKTVVGLLRGDTSTRWFHNWVLGKAELRFIRGRLKFTSGPAPFASIIAVWKPKPL